MLEKEDSVPLAKRPGYSVHWIFISILILGLDYRLDTNYE